MVNRIHNAIDHMFSSRTVLKLRYDVVPNIIQIMAGLG